MRKGRQTFFDRPSAQLDEQLWETHADENAQRDSACEGERLHAAQGEGFHVAGDERIRRVIDARAGDERENAGDDEHGGRHFHRNGQHTGEQRQRDGGQRRGQKQPQRRGKEIAAPGNRTADGAREIASAWRMKEDGKRKHAQKGGENLTRHSAIPPMKPSSMAPPHTPSAMHTAVSIALMQWITPER